jgi:large subunit ribosomal protein L24
MASFRIKKGDLVKVNAGAHKGKTAKVEKTDVKNNVVYLEGMGMTKRHIRPSQLHPKGGTKEVHKGLPISNVALVVDEAKGKTSRVSFSTNKEGKKVRIAKSTRKEIA